MTDETRRAHAVASRLMDIRGIIRAALVEELGDSYDCVRVWEAWSYGTMSAGDFIPVTDRVEDIVDSIQKALGAEQ